MSQFPKTIPDWSSEAPAGQDFSITDDKWRGIEETSYKHPIPPEARKQIIERTRNLLLRVEAEQAAALLNDARAYFVRCQAAFATVQDIIAGNPDLDIKSYASRRLNKRFLELTESQSSPRPVPPLQEFTSRARDLESMAYSFVIACDDVLDDLSEHRGRRSGETWENWVTSIAEILGEHGLPNKARTDTDKKSSDIQSEFVRLIDALQTLLPPGSYSARNSDDALAKAINRAKGSVKAAGNKTRQKRS